MKLPEFGVSFLNSNEDNLDSVIHYLDNLISEEEFNCEKTRSTIKKARLARAYDAYQALHDVANWTPKLAKHQRLKKSSTE